MIVDAVVHVVLGAVVGVLTTLLPTGAGFDMSWLSSIMAQVWAWDAYVPVHEALAVAGACLAVYIVVWTAGFWLWLWSKVPIIGS